MCVSTSGTSPARYLLVLSEYLQEVRSNRADLVRQVVKNRFRFFARLPKFAVGLILVVRSTEQKRIFARNSRFANFTRRTLPTRSLDPVPRRTQGS
jgi:hypothetical protein